MAATPATNPSQLLPLGLYTRPNVWVWPRGRVWVNVEVCVCDQRVCTPGLYPTCTLLQPPDQEPL